MNNSFPVRMKIKWLLAKTNQLLSSFKKEKAAIRLQSKINVTRVSLCKLFSINTLLSQEMAGDAPGEEATFFFVHIICRRVKIYLLKKVKYYERKDWLWNPLGNSTDVFNR